MSQPSSTEQLQPGDWERLRAAAEKLEQAWRDHAEPDLASFLPPADDPLHGSILEELVKTDLEIRRTRHYPISLDYYLVQYPKLGEAAKLPARLIYEEYRVLRRFGDPVDLEHYRQRFPKQFAELQRLISQQPIDPQDLTNLDSLSPSDETPSTPPLPIGDILAAIGEGYRPIKCIGRGSFGEVWQVEAPGGFPAAVKIVRRTLDSEEAKRELRALEVIKRLSHPHLLKTFAAWPLPHWLVILMELADCTLRDRVRECKTKGATGIPVAELLRYLQEAAEALDYLHSEEVLHRDVKPANLLLCRGHVKVADFGLIRDQKARGKSDSISGTPGYMAPEAWGRAPCAASDQYSLALTYAELRLGQWPFAVDDAPFLVHLEGTPDLTRLSEGEREILLRGMAKNWKERFPTCQALVSALRDALLSDPAQHDLVAALPSRPAATTQPMPRFATKITSLPQKNDPGTSKKQALGLFDTLGEPPQPASDTCETLAPSPHRVADSPITKAARPVTARNTRAMKKQVGKSGQTIGWAAVVLLVLVSLAAAIWRFGPGSPHVPPPEPSFALLDPQAEAVILSAGSHHPVSIGIKRQNGFREVVKLTPSVKGDGLSFGATGIASDSDNGEVLFDVAKDAAPGLRSVTVRASAEGQPEQTTSLQVVILPFGFERKGEGPTKRRETPYPSKIVRRVGPKQLEVVFVLIRREGKADAPFYLMENKVSNGMFRAFVAEKPQAVAGSLWEQGGVANGGNVGSAEDELPVFRLTRSEAEHFAAWLGGCQVLLPTAEQLDLAAGYYSPRDRRTVARGPLVADKRMQLGPRKIHDTSDDISLYGIRDLAGNGREWTRDNLLVQGQPFAVLRGLSYTARDHLSFDDIDKWIKNPEQSCPVQNPERRSWTTSFRVVLELADQPSGK